MDFECLYEKVNCHQTTGGLKAVRKPMTACSLPDINGLTVDTAERFA
jgi:hypothetical protein